MSHQPESSAPVALSEIDVRVRLDGKTYLNVRLRSSPATIGRDSKADVRLDSNQVSRVHARLFFDSESIRIVDAESRNGFSVDDAPSTEAELGPHNVVTLCGFELRARRVASAAEESDESLADGWSDIEASEPAELDPEGTDVTRNPAPPAPPVEATPSAALVETPEASSDEDDDTDFGSVSLPTGVPVPLQLLRDPTAGVQRDTPVQALAVEVVSCVGQRVVDVELLRPGSAYWWGGRPEFPATLWVVPHVDRFPLAAHHEAGRFMVQVPRDSTWKMFQRGPQKPGVHRSGHLMGMQLRAGDEAEVTAGPVAVFVRCVSAPSALKRQWTWEALRPGRFVAAAIVVALAAHAALLGVPLTHKRILIASGPPEEFVKYHDATLAATLVPAPPPPPVPASAPTSAEPTPEPAPAREVANSKPSRRDRSPPPGEPTAQAEPQSPPPKQQLSLDNFKVVGMLDRLPDIAIADAKGPAPSGGAAMLRGETKSVGGIVDKSGRDMSTNPGGRLERGQVQRVINSHAREIGKCQQRGLAENPSASGRLELQWVVEESGSVRNVRVLYDELGSPTLTRCMKEAVASWTFPAPKGGATLVSFPFRFASPKL